MKHELKITSLHDAQADCACDKWHYVGTGERTREEVEELYNQHLAMKKYPTKSYNLAEDSDISEENLRDWWSEGITIRFKKILYRVGRMSYGDYFLEPKSWQDTGHGERDGHSPNTNWFYLKDTKRRIYGLESNR